MSESAPSDRLTQVDEATNQTIYYNERRGTYHTWYDYDEYEPVTTALMMAVAAVREVDPVNLEPLSNAVEPDALNELFVHWQRKIPRAGGGTVSFSFADCDVSVQSDGEIVIDPPTSLR